MIEDAIYSKVTTDTTLNSLISLRIYPVTADQDVDYPYITYSRISTRRINALVADTDITEARFQFDTWSKSYETLRSIADALRMEFQRFRGTVSSVVIEDCDIDEERDEYNSETQVHRNIMDILITYRE